MAAAKGPSEEYGGSATVARVRAGSITGGPAYGASEPFLKCGGLAPRRTAGADILRGERRIAARSIALPKKSLGWNSTMTYEFRTDAGTPG